MPEDKCYDIAGSNPSQAISYIEENCTAGDKVLETLAKEARNVLWNNLKGDGFIKYLRPKPRKKRTLPDFCEKVISRLKHRNQEFYRVGEPDALTAEVFLRRVYQGKKEAVDLFAKTLESYVVEKPMGNPA